jgi:hypothetical protein
VTLWVLPAKPPWWRAADTGQVQPERSAEATTATEATPTGIGAPAASAVGAPAASAVGAPAATAVREQAASAVGEQAASAVGEQAASAVGEQAASAVGEQAASAPPVAEASGVRAPPLNQVLEPTRAVTFVMSADAGRIEIEPCRGRFVNVTVLDSRHRSLELVQSGRRVEVRFDGGARMASGVAHVLVPADTHLILSTRTGPIVVRGLGGPMEIDSQSGEVRVDSAPRMDPRVTIASDSGAIAWQGRCGNGCRVDARSREGDITLRAPDRSVIARGAVRGQSERGRVHFEELICTDSRCASSPLPWRQLAPGPGH